MTVFQTPQFQRQVNAVSGGINPTAHMTNALSDYTNTMEMHKMRQAGGDAGAADRIPMLGNNLQPIPKEGGNNTFPQIQPLANGGGNNIWAPAVNAIDRLSYEIAMKRQRDRNAWGFMGL